MRPHHSKLLSAAEWLWSHRGKNLYWTPAALTKSNSDTNAPKLTDVEAEGVFRCLEERGLAFQEHHNGIKVFLLNEAKQIEWAAFLRDVGLSSHRAETLKAVIALMGEALLAFWIGSELFKEKFDPNVSGLLLCSAFLCAVALVAYTALQAWPRPTMIGIVIIILCGSLLAYKRGCFTNDNRAIKTNSGWLVPELPVACNRVHVHFGRDEIYLPAPVLIASAAGPGTTRSLATLPGQLLVGVTDSPLYSPRWSSLDIKIGHAKYSFKGIEFDAPFLAFIESNRLFVSVSIPLINEMKMITLSDELDPQLLNLPRLWDRNYDSRTYEIVNEHARAILRVSYVHGDSIAIDGRFRVSTNRCLFVYGDQTRLVVFCPVIDSYKRRWNATNSDIMFTTDPGFPYEMEYPGQEALFKYPSWQHKGERVLK